VKTIDKRPAAIRGRLVNAQNGLPERHSAKDFDTLDKALFDPVRKRAG
jgi:GST-like protein